MKPIISGEDVSLFAKHFHPVIAFNTPFLLELRKRVSCWHFQTRLADLFTSLDNKTMIEVYARYTLSCNAILDRFTFLCQTNKAFHRFVLVCLFESLTQTTAWTAFKLDHFFPSGLWEDIPWQSKQWVHIPILFDSSNPASTALFVRRSPQLFVGFTTMNHTLPVLRPVVTSWTEKVHINRPPRLIRVCTFPTEESYVHMPNETLYQTNDQHWPGHWRHGTSLFSAQREATLARRRDDQTTCNNISTTEDRPTVCDANRHTVPPLPRGVWPATRQHETPTCLKAPWVSFHRHLLAD